MPAASGHTPYSRACTNCAKGKCKCIVHGNSAACERCLRLNKNCHFGSGIRKKPGRKPVSKTTQLEEKLEGLVGLLRSVPGVGNAADALLGPVRVEKVHEPAAYSVEAHQDAEPAADTASCTGLSQLSADCTAVNASPTSFAELEPHDISSLEAEESLHLFRSEKLKYFPFVHIPQSVTAAQLRAESPFLWQSIMASSSKSASRQQALGRQLQNMITEQAFGQHQRSLDILLGTLGFLGWMTYYLGAQPFMTMYSHAAVAIVQDLGIDRPAPKLNEPHPMACVRKMDFIIKLSRSPFQTMEEKRAVLGLLLNHQCGTSRISEFVKRPIGLAWTEYLDECLRSLETAHETPLDLILVQQIRLQRIIDDVPKFMPTASSLSEQTRVLRDFQSKVLLSRLEDARQILPADLPKDMLIICRLHAITTEAVIQGLALHPVSTEASHPDMQRISMLSACLRLTKVWFDEIFALPKTCFLMFSFTIIYQLSHFMSLLYKLSTLEVPCWEVAAVRQTLSVSATLDVLATRFARGPIAAGFVSDNVNGDIFSRGGRALRLIKTTWEATFAETGIQAVEQPKPSAQAENLEDVPYDGIMNDEFSAEFSGGLNDWLTDMFAPEWYSAM